MNSAAAENSSSSERGVRWQRFLVASSLFLVFETIMIFALRWNIDDLNSSETTFWFLVAASTAGFFLIGAFGRSALTVFVVLLPALIAYLIEPSVDDPRGEIWPFGAVWSFYSMLVFLPAWCLGLFIYLASRYGRDST